MDNLYCWIKIDSAVSESAYLSQLLVTLVDAQNYAFIQTMQMGLAIVPGINEKSTSSQKLVVFQPSHFKSFSFQVIDFKSTSSRFSAKWGQIC